ncbi:MAG TPA: acyl-CoA dehydrogenase family protein [Acidimicrobiales bacterium]|nr:acyl-CoA dehydrogenase family protein [Acidimicrobiales bacterium]
MHVDLTPEQRALQSEIRTYFTNLMTRETKARIRGAEEGENKEYKELIKQVGRDGWLGTAWPKEYGGKGFSPIENYIFFNEAQAAGCPIPFLTTNTVGPTLRSFGSTEQKDFFLPKILKGEMHFSIGYSEPEAGTDLASLKTRAVLDGDEWVINGQKLFTSLAYNADYVWLAARTDPDAPAHKGISIFLVPATSPGFKIVPYITMGQSHTTATYYDNVRVPKAALVGEVNGGWSLITNQLNHERVSLCAAGGITNLVREAVAWAKKEHLPDGRRVIDQEWVQIKLAECRARVRFLDLLNWKVAFNSTKGALNPADASAVKVFGSESMHTIYKLLTEVFGATGHLRPGSPGAILAGRVEESYRGCWVLTFGGGTNEIQRDIIGMVGLKLPREKRRK